MDFDHFSLDDRSRSEAAGWITGLEARLPGSVEPRINTNRHESERGTNHPRSHARDPENTEGDHASGVTSAASGEVAGIVANASHDNSSDGGLNGEKSSSGTGLWAQIRWSDVGEEAVKGGRYRFLSPVWARRDCVDLGDGRVRPVRLLNAAVTNDPNLKGLRPLSNRQGSLTTDEDKASGGGVEPRMNTNEHESGNATGGDEGVIPTGFAVRDSAHGGPDGEGNTAHGAVTTDGEEGPANKGRNEDPVDSRVLHRGSGRKTEDEGQRTEVRNDGSRNMKKVIEALVNRLGLASDAKEEDVLAAMEKLPSDGGCGAVSGQRESYGDGESGEWGVGVSDRGGGRGGAVVCV